MQHPFKRKDAETGKQNLLPWTTITTDSKKCSNEIKSQKGKAKTLFMT